MPAQPSFLASSLLVAAGGAVGAWLRFLIGHASRLLPGYGGFPWGTLTCNVLGSLAMGVLVGFLARTGGASEGVRLLLGVGVLGGFTTFSSLALEFALFVERGELATAASYLALTLGAGFAGLFAGLALTRAAA